MSSLSNRNTNNTRSVILAFSSLASSLKIYSILKPLIRGVLLFKLIWWSISLIPLIKSSASKRRALLAMSILLDGEIISPYSCYTKKGLVYITILKFFGRQSFSYTKYTKLSTYVLYDVHSVFLISIYFLLVLLVFKVFDFLN